MSYVKEAINTLEAGNFEIVCAKLFGKKSKGVDGNTVVKLAYWRGKVYLIDQYEVSND